MTVCLLLIIVTALTSCSSPSGTQDQTGGDAKPPSSAKQPPAEEPSDQSGDGSTSATETPSTDEEKSNPQDEPSYTKEAELIAVGDIMMHSPQITAGYDPVAKTYSYDSFFTEVQPILSKGDWVWGNLETPLAGADLKYTGYPMFNAPPELASALKNAGFNIITNANNHSLDRREQGVLRTLDRLKEQGLITKGTAASQEEADKPVIVEKNGIAMGILAYTYGTNGIPIPQGKPYLVSLIDEQRMSDDIAKLRAAGADVVTVAVHFGLEYQREANEQQKDIAKKLIAAGADIILGSHPHVVQPYEMVEAEAADGSKHSGLVIYSLGNFISNQTGRTTDYGLILSVKIKKHFPDGGIELTDIDAMPTWVHIYEKSNGNSKAKGKKQYRILPLEPLLAERNDPLLKAKDYDILNKSLQAMKQHVESYMMTASAAPVQ